MVHHQPQQTILVQEDVHLLQIEDKVEEKEGAEQQMDPDKDKYEGSNLLVVWVPQMGQVWWKDIEFRRQECLLVEGSDKEQGGV